MFSVAAGTWPLPLASRGFLTSGSDDLEGGFPLGRWIAGRCLRAVPSLCLKQKEGNVSIHVRLLYYKKNLKGVLEKSYPLS